MRKIVIPVILIWLILVGLSLTWNLSADLNYKRQIAYQTARSLFNFIVVTREWNARHGGIYARILKENKGDTQGTSFKNVRLGENLLLTKINPVLMTRQLSEIAGQYEGVQFHLTSLQPLRPSDRPDPEEENAFSAFNQGEKEIGKVIEKEEGSFFFYMAPLKTKKPCLECHTESLSRSEAVKGGISIKIPFDSSLSFRIITAHLLIGLGGLLGIGLLSYRLTQAYDSLKKQTEFDDLTGVYNYHRFTGMIVTEIGRSLREQVPLSVLICDIDRFKEYNEKLGRSRGNECLKKVAWAIKSNLKRPGDFCARYGGEEFIIVLPQTPQAGALYLADKIRESVYQLELSHDQQKSPEIITISIGVTTLPENLTMSYEKLVSQADKALNQARSQGGNRIEFFADSEDY